MNGVEAYFDDISVEHIASKVSQVADYYPFGMQIKQTSTSITSSLANKYLYNGNELERELGLDIYDYQFRFYDPALGKFLSIDPLAEEYHYQSSYNYALDNPIRFIDKLGMGPYVYDEQEDGTWKRRENEENDGGEDRHTYNFSDGSTLYFNKKEGVYQTDSKNREDKAKSDSENTDSEFKPSGYTVIVEKGNNDETGIEGESEGFIDLTEMQNGPGGSNPKNVYDAAQNIVKVMDNIKSFFKKGEGQGDTVRSYNKKAWTDNEKGERRAIWLNTPYDTLIYDYKTKSWSSIE